MPFLSLVTHSFKAGRRANAFSTPAATWDPSTDITAAIWFDASDAPITSISGLDHLEGEQVTILADGSTHSAKTVSSGAISLDRSASTIQIGLGYESILQTMRIEAGAQQGVAQSRIKRIHEITLRLFRSVGLEVGSNLADMETIPFRTSSDAMDVATLEFTGDKDIEFRGDFETDGYIYIRQTQPLPTNVIGIYPRVTTNEG